jgi:DHA1 family multidrug resistance protein-like MFS transporter
VLGISGAIASVASTRSGGQISLRHLVMGAALVSGITTYIVGLATSPAMALGTLFFTGLAQGILASSSTALISLFAPANRQGTAFGMLTSAQSLAMGAGPLTGGVMASMTDLRTPFAAAGALLVVGALLILAVPAPPAMSESEAAAS